METKYLLALLIIVILYCCYQRPKENFVSENFSTEILHESKPKIMKLGNFLDREECDHIIKLCQKRFNRSGVMNKKGGTGESTVRTSYSCYLGEGETDIVKDVEERAAKIANVDVDQIESLQVVRYHPGQKYDSHNDWFNTQGLNNQRYVTILAYLNDDFTGGQTDFVNLNVSGKPKKGDAIMWYNCVNNDIKSCYDDAKHRGSPPTSGVKYALNIWIRFKKYRGSGRNRSIP